LASALREPHKSLICSKQYTDLYLNISEMAAASPVRKMGTQSADAAIRTILEKDPNARVALTRGAKELARLVHQANQRDVPTVNGKGEPCTKLGIIFDELKSKPGMVSVRICTNPDVKNAKKRKYKRVFFHAIKGDYCSFSALPEDKSEQQTAEGLFHDIMTKLLGWEHGSGVSLGYESPSPKKVQYFKMKKKKGEEEETMQGAGTYHHTNMCAVPGKLLAAKGKDSEDEEEEIDTTFADQKAYTPWVERGSPKKEKSEEEADEEEEEDEEEATAKGKDKAKDEEAAQVTATITAFYGQFPPSKVLKMTGALLEKVGYPINKKGCMFTDKEIKELEETFDPSNKKMANATRAEVQLKELCRLVSVHLGYEEDVGLDDFEEELRDMYASIKASIKSEDEEEEAQAMDVTPPATPDRQGTKRAREEEESSFPDEAGPSAPKKAAVEKSE